MVKYAPRKVCIKERGRYVELFYIDFCHRRESLRTSSQVGARLGITQSVVNKRKARILIKLKNIIEN